MNSDQPKSVGRPRVYGDASEKLSAFRSRQAASGYVRREVLLSPADAESVKALATAHGVTALDVTSALFEMGLAQYRTGFVAPVGAGLVASAAAGATGNSLLSVQASSAVEANPIQSFFTRRKDAHAQQAS